MTEKAQKKAATRLYLPASYAQGQLHLDRDQAHYLRSVLRLGAQDRILVFNGEAGEWLAEIEELGKKEGRLRLLAQTRPQEPQCDLWLCFAPVKRQRIDTIVEKAAELGCSVVQPVITRFTNVERVNLERLRATVREAAEQCERTSLPEVRDPLRLPELISNWPGERRLLMADEARDAPEAASLLRSEGSGAWALLTGPEGGFEASERELLNRQSFVRRCSLGPRILRADTAVIAGLTLLQAVVGDWRKDD